MRKQNLIFRTYKCKKKFKFVEQNQLYPTTLDISGTFQASMVYHDTLMGSFRTVGGFLRTCMRNQDTYQQDTDRYI